MYRALIILFALVILCSLNLSCTQKAVTAYSQQKGSQRDKVWKQFNFKENKFSILFPEEPRISKQEIDSVNGKFVVSTYYVEQPNVSYAVSVTTLPVKIDYSSRAKEILDQTKDQTISQYKGTLIEESAINIDGFPGKEFGFATQNSIWKDRLYLADDKIYLVFVQTKKTLDNTEKPQNQDELSKNFFDSFRLITSVE